MTKALWIRIFIIFSVFVCINYYLFKSGWQALPDNPLLHFVYAAVFLTCALSFFIGMAVGHKIPVIFGIIFENIGAFWMIGFLFLLLAAFLGDILKFTDHIFGIFPTFMKVNYGETKLIYLISVLGMIFLLFGIGYFRFAHPKTVTLQLDVNKKSNYSDQLSVVAASDIHLGGVIRKRRLAKYVKLINKQKADIILLAGDLFDRNLYLVDAQGMDSELKKLKARYGVYAIFGNHDYYGNAHHAKEIMERSGINLLHDEAVTIDDRFVLVGRKDYSQRDRATLDSLISEVNKELPIILLDHQPVKLSDAVDNNIDFQISGHTHNGQVFPINRIVAKIYELAYGYRKIKDTHFYVSSGLGLWGAPVRLGTQSEIVNIQMKFLGNRQRV